MEETFRLMDAAKIARLILEAIPKEEEKTTIVALRGDLGAGKTTLTQAIGHKLGVTEALVSPTFVVMKRYSATMGNFSSIIHIDAYRIEDERELLPLHFEELTKEPGTLMIIEWPEKITNALSGKKVHYYEITHKNNEERVIKKI